MSVDAVNGVNAQQQPHKSSALPSAIAGGVGLGAVGATAGYFLGGKKPTLEELFTQKPDTFTKKEITDKDADAAKKLQDAAAEYKSAGNTEAKTWLDAQHKVGEAIDNTSVDNVADLEKNITEAQTKLNDKKVKIGDKELTRAEIKEEFKQAKQAVEAAKNGDDAAKAAATKRLNDARANIQTFNKEAKTEIGDLAKAKKALVDAKKAKFEEAAKADGAEKTLKTAAEDAKKAFGEAKSNKLKEITGRDEIKQAFDKIKGALAKEGKGKMAAIAGGIAAAVGLVAGYLMSGSHNDNA